MELIEMKLEDIHPYERNPRKNDGAVSSVAESIKQCGYVAPIIEKDIIKELDEKEGGENV